MPGLLLKGEKKVKFRPENSAQGFLQQKTRGGVDGGENSGEALRGLGAAKSIEVAMPC